MPDLALKELELERDLERAVLALEEARHDVRSMERERDQIIRECLELGWTVTELAELTGVSRQRIYQVKEGK